MKRCRKFQKQFINVFYDELNKNKKTLFENHLKKCPQCTEKYSHMESILKQMTAYSRPEPGTEFWDNYWNKLASRLEAEKTARFSLTSWCKQLIDSVSWQTIRVYRVPVTAAAILLIGIFIGKTFFTGSGVPLDRSHTKTTPSIKNSAVEQRAEHYLERAKLVLLGIVNYDPTKENGYKPDFSHHKQISSELITEAARLKHNLKSPKQLRLRQLISDLEVILIQIANLETEYDLEDVELIQSSAERKAILFKINIGEILSDTKNIPFSPSAEIQNKSEKI